MASLIQGLVTINGIKINFRDINIVTQIFGISDIKILYFILLSLNF